LFRSADSGTHAWTTGIQTYNVGERSYLLSPPFDFSTFTQAVRLSMFVPMYFCVINHLFAF
jgi:hypothetical protein